MGKKCKVSKVNCLAISRKILAFSRVVLVAFQPAMSKVKYLAISRKILAFSRVVLVAFQPVMSKVKYLSISRQILAFSCSPSSIPTCDVQGKVSGY